MLFAIISYNNYNNPTMDYVLRPINVTNYPENYFDVCFVCRKDIDFVLVSY